MHTCRCAYVHMCSTCRPIWKLTFSRSERKLKPYFSAFFSSTRKCQKMCPHWFRATCLIHKGITTTKHTPTVPVPTKNIHFLPDDDDWHPSKMHSCETNSHNSIGRAVQEPSIDHAGRQEWASQNHFFTQRHLGGSIWCGGRGRNRLPNGGSNLPPQVMQGMRDVLHSWVVMDGYLWRWLGRWCQRVAIEEKTKDFSWVCANVIDFVLKEIQNYNNNFHAVESKSAKFK